MKLASENKTKVLLDGQGADESLGGYSIFTGVLLLELIKKMKFKSFYQHYKLLKINRGVSSKNEINRSSP